MPAPRKLNDERLQEVAKAFEVYIQEKDDPIIAGFLAYDLTALKYWVNDEDLERNPILKRYKGRALKKQEAYIVGKGMNGQSTAMSIFRLKQPYFGYKDRVEQDITTNGERISFANTVPRPEKKKKK